MFGMDWNLGTVVLKYLEKAILGKTTLQQSGKYICKVIQGVAEARYFLTLISNITTVITNL